MIFITQKNGKKSSVNKLFAALPEVYSYTIQGISKHGGSYLWRAAEDYLHVHQKIHRIKSYGKSNVEQISSAGLNCKNWQSRSHALQAKDVM
jgi:hypothetical protein